MTFYELMGLKHDKKKDVYWWLSLGTVKEKDLAKKIAVELEKKHEYLEVRILEKKREVKQR